MSIGFWQIAIVVVLVVLLFGRGKISSLMGDVAKGIKSFKKGMSSDVTEDSESNNIANDNSDSKKESVPNIDESIFPLSIKPADVNSSIFGKSDNFCKLK